MPMLNKVKKAQDREQEHNKANRKKADVAAIQCTIKQQWEHGGTLLNRYKV